MGDSWKCRSSAVFSRNTVVYIVFISFIHNYARVIITNEYYYSAMSL